MPCMHVCLLAKNRVVCAKLSISPSLTSFNIPIIFVSRDVNKAPNIEAPLKKSPPSFLIEQNYEKCSSPSKKRSLPTEMTKVPMCDLTNVGYFLRKLLTLCDLTHAPLAVCVT